MFVAAPVISVGAQEEGLVPPPAVMVAELTNTDVLKTRKRHGRDFEYRKVKLARLGLNSSVTTADLENAMDYKFDASLAALMSVR